MEPAAIVLGVDIGATKTAVLAEDVATGEQLYRDTFLTPAADGVEAVIDALYDVIDRLPKGREHLAAVGVGVPGQVDLNGNVLWAGNLRGWVQVPFRERLSADLRLPVFVEQDAKVAALGERWRGCAKAMRDFVFLALGTGIGAGIVVDGQLVRGTHHASGEVGSMVFPVKGGHGSGSARRNQLAQVIGSKALSAKAEKATGEKLSAAEAVAGAEEEPALEPVADEFLEHLAIAVVNTSVLLDPEAIIFGGGTAQAGEPFLKRIRARVASELKTGPRLICSALGTDAQLHGSIWGALKALREAAH